MKFCLFALGTSASPPPKRVAIKQVEPIAKSLQSSSPRDPAHAP